MPVYCYRCNACRQLTEEHRSIADREQPVRCDCGGWAERDIRAEHVSSSRGDHPGYPYESDAMGCLPKQIPEMQACLKREHGVHADFTPDGRAVIRNRRHFRQMKRAMGLQDRSGFD